MDELCYATAEHYMMAAKARLFGNNDIAEQIITGHSPGHAKQLGHNVTGFDEHIWQVHR